MDGIAPWDCSLSLLSLFGWSVELDGLLPYTFVAFYVGWAPMPRGNTDDGPILVLATLEEQFSLILCRGGRLDVKRWLAMDREP